MPDGSAQIDERKFPGHPLVYTPQQGTYGVDLGVHRGGDGLWVVQQYTHILDRCGDKDTLTDTLSSWASEAEAQAEMARVLRGSL